MNNITSKIKTNPIVKMLKNIFKDEQIWVVGGFVRDCALSADICARCECCDVDLAVEKGHAKNLQKNSPTRLKGTSYRSMNSIIYIGLFFSTKIRMLILRILRVKAYKRI